MLWCGTADDGRILGIDERHNGEFQDIAVNDKAFQGFQLAVSDPSIKVEILIMANLTTNWPPCSPKPCKFRHQTK